MPPTHAHTATHTATDIQEQSKLKFPNISICRCLLSLALLRLIFLFFQLSASSQFDQAELNVEYVFLCTPAVVIIDIYLAKMKLNGKCELWRIWSSAVRHTPPRSCIAYWGSRRKNQINIFLLSFDLPGRNCDRHHCVKCHTHSK